MPTETVYRAGDLVDLYDEGEIVCAVVTGEEKNRLKVTTESGKEMRVVPSRVAQRVSWGLGGRDAMATARDHARATRGQLDAIDTAALWDVLVDEPRRYTLEEVAALALGEPSPVARSATLRRLAADRLHFVRKGDDYEPRPREQVEEALKREAAERARAERRDAFIRAGRAALAGERRSEPLDRRAHGETIADLVEAAIMGDEAPAKEGAQEILDATGAPAGALAERAFALLLALGVFAPDENLFIHRFNLRTAFPPEVLEAAGAALRQEDTEQGRVDLRGLDAFTIDDERTTEMDDAISVEPSGEGRLRAGIHIADPCRFVRPGDSVDVEALKRAATFYFPDARLPMLPPAIAEHAASLVARQDRPALSFLVTVSPAGEILEQRIVPSTIRSIARLTYEAADALLEEGRAEEVVPEPGAAARISVALRALRPICEALEARRIDGGAIQIRAPEISLAVEPGGKVMIRRIEDRGMSRRMVAEMMILANRVAAEFCIERALPAIYRRQPPPLEPSGPGVPAAATAGAVPEAGGGEPAYDPVAVKALRRRMRRGEVGLAPDRHHGLGLAAYTQATSPIRRYQDLAMHRQILAALAGLSPVYTAEALARIAATTEEAERMAREAERGTSDYWILRHYETRVGEQIEGVVLAVDPRRTEIELSDTLYTVFLPARPEHRPGARLRFTIDAVRPRARRLTLREALP